MSSSRRAPGPERTEAETGGTTGPPASSSPPDTADEGVRVVLERATVREVLMGAQDNLTNVLAVVLGVAIGSGRADLVALAGLSAAVAEAVSMGGVLYTSTRAERGRESRARTPNATQGARGPMGGPAALADEASDRSDRADGPRLSPALSGLTTFAAAMLAGLLPLVPFAFLTVAPAALASVAVSLTALFGLGAVTGRVSGNVWWQDGLRLIVVAGLAALAAAAVGSMVRVG